MDSSDEPCVRDGPTAHDVRAGPGSGDGLTVHHGWRVERVLGSVGELVARPWREPPGRTVRFLSPSSPGIVLGSTQAPTVIDAGAAAAAGVEVVRRRSGGGAVLVEPGRLVWVEVAIGADDPLWQADVGRAGIWLGRAWQAALVSLGVGTSGAADAAGGGPAVGSTTTEKGLGAPTTTTTGKGLGALVAEADSGHAARNVVTRASDGEGVAVSVTEATVRTEWSPLICFAGKGPGEVSVGGRKVVGVSQRRTRAGARFQCGALMAIDPAALPGLLALDPPARERATDSLAAATMGLGALGVTAADLEAALLAALPLL